MPVIRPFNRAQNILRSGRIRRRCGTELLAIIQHKDTDVNNFLLYHREKEQKMSGQSVEFGPEILRVCQKIYL